MKAAGTCGLIYTLVSLLALRASAAVTIETVPVGAPGNAGEWSGSNYGGSGDDRLCGAVAYTYNIGKYEVTAGHYTVFLNAVAATDTYGLYSQSMWDDATLGCRIERSGSPGSYTYSVAADHANRPVNYVSWGDSARFANWLHNGQPTGLQNASTTEDGAYYLNGATTDAELQAVTRKADWRWAITNEDEWYKAAYYNPATGSYYDYPTSSNTISSGMANYATSVGGHTTDVGSYPYPSPYGTFDQGGNVWEFTESVIPNSYRGVRGGSFSWGLNESGLLAARRGSVCEASGASSDVGFRVVQIPEPTTMTILAFGAIGALVKRRRR